MVTRPRFIDDLLILLINFTVRCYRFPMYCRIRANSNIHRCTITLSMRFCSKCDGSSAGPKPRRTKYEINRLTRFRSILLKDMYMRKVVSKYFPSRRSR